MAEATTTEPTTQAPGHEVLLTQAAAAKVASLLTQEGRDDLDGDAVRAFPTGDPQMPQVEVVVDRMSVPYLSGATIDFADTIEKQGFTIDNPNATGTCACGESFH